MPATEGTITTSETFATFKAQLNQCLLDYCNKQHQNACVQDGGYEELWESILRLIKVGGKRMRPYLLMQAYEMYGGKDMADVLPAAAAQELLHLSMLVHDDVIDRDDIRYGILNIGGTYKKKYQAMDSVNAEHYANSAALLGGDILLSGAYNIILTSKMSAEAKVITMQQLAETIFVVVGGELTDMESTLYAIEAYDPLKIAENKTAFYSFVGPLRSGALLAGAPEQDIAALTEYGISLGIAFQLADDILGIFGDEAVTGKSALSDIQEGKRTYLMSQAFALASPEQRQILERHNGSQAVTSTDAAEVMDIITSCGALRATQEKIKSLSQQAERALERLSVDLLLVTPLRSLITSVTERDK